GYAKPAGASARDGARSGGVPPGSPAARRAPPPLPPRCVSSSWPPPNAKALTSKDLTPIPPYGILCRGRDGIDMGGIAGCTGDRRAAVATMLRAMTHRGPDGSGLTTHHGTVLGRDRLAVLDLHAGRQPLVNEDGTPPLAFQGEIYNAGARGPDLKTGGHRFATRNGCEVGLHLYENEGPACIARLDGSFALA